MTSRSTDKPDLSTTLLVSTVVLTVTGAVFVLTRLWVRFFYTKAHGWDDYFITGSLAASVSSMALTIAMWSHGYGKSIMTLDPADAVAALKFSNFAVLINGFSMAFLKISIGLSLLRLQLGKGMVWIVWGSIVLSIVCNATVVVGTLFGCRPLAAVWDRSLWPTASCLPRVVNVTMSYIQTCGNIVTDLFFTLGPLYYISRVKVSVYNKWALRGVFLLGLLATICAIAKCFELPKLKSTTDPTADGAPITIWVRAELNAGLIAAAIPPLKAVFEQILRNVFGIRSGLHGATAYGSQAPRSNTTKRSRPRDLDDDEIAMHSHAAHVQGNASSSVHLDGESMDEERRNRVGRVDSAGEEGFGGITKTVRYTVHDAVSDNDIGSAR